MAERFLASLAARETVPTPFRHWLLRQVLPDEAASAVCALPLDAPAIGETCGKRETHNSSRLFIDPAKRSRFPVCAGLVAMLSRRETVAGLEAACEVSLESSYLRIEYCQDRGGFWLEPHTDIAVKRLTMLIYLSRAPAARDWGTDLYEADGSFAGSAPGDFDCGLIFVPGQDTWHGFRKRAIVGVRRSLIVNYVTEAWRARHELADPERPIASKVLATSPLLDRSRGMAPR